MAGDQRSASVVIQSVAKHLIPVEGHAPTRRSELRRHAETV
jgi:hypothetical protein